ncbi:MAG TPA: hypothetical protein VFB13_21610 [Reyranella sp.]|jgi:uncharacterized membrane protein YhaH (DUF805 family)|nr:hypothetical protein [Reyranella sp.]
MSNDLVPQERPVSPRFHPGVFKIVACLLGLFVLAAWTFAGGGHTDFLLVMVTYVFGLAVLLPGALLLARRSQRGRRPDAMGDLPLPKWAKRPVETSTGTVKGSVAATELILPIAAVAIGMVCFATVLHIVR